MKNCWLLASFLIWTASAAACNAQSVARILDVQGNIEIAGAAGVRAAEVFGNISVDEQLVLPRGAAIVLAWIDDGRLERLTAAGKWKVQKDRVAAVAEGGLAVVKIPSRRRGIVINGVKSLPPISEGAVTVTRSGGSDPVPPRVSPPQDSTVLELRPAFAWPAVADATKYQVKLFLGVDLLWAAESAKPALEYPAKSQALESELTYRWEVKATLNDKSQRLVAESEFTTASPQQLDEIAALKNLADETPPPEKTALLSLLAIVREQSGMIAEAIQTYEDLCKASPAAAAYREALADLYLRAGRPKDSERMQREAAELKLRRKTSQ